MKRPKSISVDAFVNSMETLPPPSLIEIVSNHKINTVVCPTNIAEISMALFRPSSVHRLRPYIATVRESQLSFIDTRIIRPQIKVSQHWEGRLLRERGATPESSNFQRLVVMLYLIVSNLDRGEM
jgi:hypothetical protein